MESVLTAGQLRAARGLLGLSQRDLAGLSKVSRATIADFEAGKRQPYPRTLVDLQRALEAAGIAFVGDDDHVGVKIKRSLLPEQPAVTTAAPRTSEPRERASSPRRVSLRRQPSEEGAESGLTAEQIKAGRELLGWSQSELATKVGASETAVGLFEREKRRLLTVDTAKLRAALESGGVEFPDAGEPNIKLKLKPKEPEIPLEEFLSQLEGYEQTQLRPKGISLGPKSGVKFGFALLYLDRASASLMLEGKELGRVRWSEGEVEFEPPISESDRSRTFVEKLADWAGGAYARTTTGEAKPMPNIRQYVPKSDDQREPPRFVAPSWLKRSS
jgi:transcriptional regulator with XRE-family HTH domain